MSLNQRIQSIISKKLQEQQSIDIISQSQHTLQKPITQCVDKLFKLIVKLKQSKSRAEKQFPVQVRQKIFIGNYVFSGNEQFLLQKNVGLVISCMDVSPLKMFPNVQYQKISIKDCEGQNLLIHAERVFNLIENHCFQQTDTNIFIHCFHGKSRSVAVLLMYLMQKQRIGFNWLYNQIRQNYPSAKINSWFIKQLRDYEKRIGLEEENNQKPLITEEKLETNVNNEDLLSSDLHHMNDNHDLLGFSNQTQLISQLPPKMINQPLLINLHQNVIDPRQHMLIPESQKMNYKQKKKQQYHLIEIQQDQDNNGQVNNVQNVELI